MGKFIEQYWQAIAGLVLLGIVFGALQKQVEHNNEANAENKESIEKCVTDIRVIRQAVTERLRRDMADTKYVSKELFVAQLKNFDDRMKRIDSALEKILVHIERKRK